MSGQMFNVNTQERFITIRQNKVRDTTTNLICDNVIIEPPLLPLSGESLSERKVNIQDSTRVDLNTRRFWIAKQKTFLT